MRAKEKAADLMPFKRCVRQSCAYPKAVVNEAERAKRSPTKPAYL
jgi:hypothetical protein